MASRNDSSSSSNFQRSDSNRSSFAGRRGDFAAPFPPMNRPSDVSSSQASDFQRGNPYCASFRRRGMSTGNPHPSTNRASDAPPSQAVNFQRGDPNRASYTRRRGMSTGQPYSHENRSSDVSSAAASNFQRGDPNRASYARSRVMSAGQPYQQENRSSDVSSAAASNFQRGDPNRASLARRRGMSTGHPHPPTNRSWVPPSQSTDFQRGNPYCSSFARRGGMAAGQAHPQGNRSTDAPKEPPVRADHSFGSGWRAAAQSAQAKNAAEDLIAPLSNVSFKKPMDNVRGQFNSDNHGRNTKNSQQKNYSIETDLIFRGGPSSNASVHNGTMIGIESQHKEQKQKSSIFSVFGKLGFKNAQQQGPPSQDSKDRRHGHASSGNENVRGNIQSTSSQGSECGPSTSSQFGETSSNKRVLRSNFNVSFSAGIDEHNTSVRSNVSFANTSSVQSKPVDENSRLGRDKDAGASHPGMLQKFGIRVAAGLSKAFYCPDKTLPSISKVNKKKSRSQRSRGRSSSRGKDEEGSSGERTPKTVRRVQKQRSRASSRADDSSDAEGHPHDTSSMCDDSVFDESGDESYHVPEQKLKRSASSVSSRFSRKQSEEVTPSKGPRTRSSFRMDSNRAERLNQTLDVVPTTGNVSFSESQMNQSFAGEASKKNVRFVRNKSRASVRLDTSLGWSQFSMMEEPSTPPSGWRYVAFIKNLEIKEVGPLESKVGVYYTHDGFVKNMPEILVQNGVCYFYRENSDDAVQMPPHFEFNLFPDVPCSPGTVIAGKYQSLKDTDPRVEIFAKQLISGKSLRDLYTQIVRPTPGSDSGNIFSLGGESSQSNNVDSRPAPEVVKTEASVAPPVKRQLLLPKQVKAGRPENALPPTRVGDLHTFSPRAEDQQPEEPSTPPHTSASVAPLLASHSRWTVYKDEDEDHPSIKRRRHGDAPSGSTAVQNLNTNPETPRSRNSASGNPRKEFWRDCKRANPFAK
ncbi:hypothetical protein CAEBREN_10280 [Caenorhabditis brenneri]|uniref:Uncharacterized protein n=1 Tax=Caenorhabditis brenneri TaxID=135651 RepID=G0M7K4_CAEBE|nr:hypothetical protein CAEBREN_10280 [Caenorhabditis brenneri]